MAGAKSNPPKARKRVEAETLKRARDGSAFTKCEACNKDVPVVLIDMHSCSLDSKIRQSLESQVVEKVVEAKKPEKKRSSPSSEKKESSAKKSKKSKDSSKRKRPPTAFFVFMDDFRKEFKEANPDNKKVALVAKEGGEKWKSMTEEEKKPYIEKAAQLKAEYENAVEEENDADNDGEDANEEQNVEDGEDEKVASDKEDEAVSDKEEAVSEKEHENED
ncbi:high mobility group B protein 7-like protein [Carex littledalei]|uniref:High mobility group B protein 7-like protein n=1 Tax=Carex littledalei TaxID=544730 RepID=A0A833R505_9POAL|nr:high mobility group B protein 7-like protein [Carex littledalei]